MYVFFYVILLGLSRKTQKYIQELVKQTATLTMNKGGVVRNIKYSGTITLPQRMKQAQSQLMKKKKEKGKEEEEEKGVYATVGE